MVGHCALRRAVMGGAAVGERAEPGQLERMRALLDECLDAGGLGLSSSRSFTHRDGDDRPVPSRFASEEELLALCATTGRAKAPRSSSSPTAA